MEQDKTAETSGEGTFTPAPLADILRSDAAPEPREPAGRQATEAPTPATAETGETPVDLTKDARPRDEQGRFAPKADEHGEAGPPPDQKQESAPQTVPVAAVLEERKKRQALEARIKEMEARYAAPPVPTPSPAEPETPLEDLMFQAPDKFVERVQAPLRKQVADMQLMMGEMIARQQPDYDAAETAVFEALERDPAAKQRVADFVNANPMQAPQWVLQEGRKLLREQQWGAVIQQYGSPDALMAALRQQAPAASAPSSAPPATPPASLASIRSAGPRAAPGWNGPTPLSSILGTRR